MCVPSSFADCDICWPQKAAAHDEHPAKFSISMIFKHLKSIDRNQLNAVSKKLNYFAFYNEKEGEQLTEKWIAKKN